jgi:hypothetical protein
MAKRTMFRLDAQAVADLAAIREEHKCATDAEAIRLALRIAREMSWLWEGWPESVRALADTPRTCPTPPADPSTSTEH